MPMLERRMTLFICTKDDMTCDPMSRLLAWECEQEYLYDQLQLDLQRQAELSAEKPCPMRTAKVDFSIVQDWDAYQCEYSTVV
jgi:hypothetical protein